MSDTPTLAQIVEALVTASEDPLNNERLAASIRIAVDQQREDAAEAAAAAAESAPDDAPAPAPPENDAALTALAEVTEEAIDEAITALNQAYEETGRALAIVRRPRGWQLMTRPEYSEFLHALFPDRRPKRLSGPALETLAIVAYRQPVTKAEIESVRGVSADGMIQKLLDLEFIKIGGRAKLPGRPLQYETTEKFLEHFNLLSPDELPNAPELQRVKLPTAEEAAAEEAAKLTAEEGSDTSDTSDTSDQPPPTP